MSTGTELETNLDINEMLTVCNLCNSTTVSDGGRCKTCRVPLAISTRFSNIQNSMLFLPILGGQGVGKTTYMAMLLEMLRHGSYNIFANLNLKATRCLQQRTMQDLFDRRFPPATPERPDYWNWALTPLEIFDDRPSKKSLSPMSLLRRTDDGAPKLAARYDWCAPDWSGAAIEQALQNPGNCPSISGNLARARGVVLLLDATKIADETQSQHQDLLAAHLASLVQKNSTSNHADTQLRDIPLAIAFTKTDRCAVAAEMPTQFAQRFLPQFCQFVHANFQTYKFFALSVAGGVTRVQGDQYVPFFIQPKGIVDPFAWALYSQIYLNR